MSGKIAGGTSINCSDTTRKLNDLPVQVGKKSPHPGQNEDKGVQFFLIEDSIVTIPHYFPPFNIQNV